MRKAEAFGSFYVRFSVELLASLMNSRFCLSAIACQTNGQMDNSDHVTCCGGSFHDFDGIIWVFSRVILSYWISVSKRFIYCSNWLRSSSSFRKNWFTASIPLWCCTRKCLFSTWVCFDEKTPAKCYFHSTDGFCICPIFISEWEDFLFCSVFYRVFSVGFEVGSAGVSPRKDSVIVSVWLLSTYLFFR